MKALHFLPITLLSIISCMSIIACSNDDSNKKNVRGEKRNVSICGRPEND